jgi:hypothetical protein
MTSQLNASALHHCGGMGEMVKDLCDWNVAVVRACLLRGTD